MYLIALRPLLKIDLRFMVMDIFYKILHKFCTIFFTLDVLYYLWPILSRTCALSDHIDRLHEFVLSTTFNYCFQ